MSTLFKRCLSYLLLSSSICGISSAALANNVATLTIQNNLKNNMDIRFYILDQSSNVTITPSSAQIGPNQSQSIKFDHANKEQRQIVNFVIATRTSGEGYFTCTYHLSDTNHRTFPVDLYSSPYPQCEKIGSFYLEYNQNKQITFQ